MAENEVLSLEPASRFTSDASPFNNSSTIPSMRRDDTIRHFASYIGPDEVFCSDRLSFTAPIGGMGDVVPFAENRLQDELPIHSSKLD